MNRIGFRYIPAGVCPPGSALPCRTIESLPQSYRVSWEDRSSFVKVTPDGLGLMGERGFRSARCNAPVREGKWYMEVRIEDGGGDRPTHAPDANMRQGSHVRLGWARREAPLNGPVGLDAYSYGYRDSNGDKLYLARPRPYGRSFRGGDVIGMYISLPSRRRPDPHDPHDPAHIRRERIAIEFKGQEYFESLEYAQNKEMTTLMDFSNKSSNTASLPSASSNKKAASTKNLPERGARPRLIPEAPVLRPLPTLPDSYIAFFVNGECQGIAFEDLFDYLPLRTTPASRKKEKDKKRAREGAPREHKENPFDDGTLGYYPFISLFNYARVRLNPGPNFDFAPPPDIDTVLKGIDHTTTQNQTWRPICERYSEYMKEQWNLDEQEEEQAKLDAGKKAQVEKVEAQRKAQREKSRKQNDARKKAKKNAELRASSVASAQVSATELAVPVDDRLESSDLTALSVQVTEHIVDQSHSPAPTAASSVDLNHVLEAESGYNSEVVDGDGEEEQHDGFAADLEQRDDDDDEDEAFREAASPYRKLRTQTNSSSMDIDLEDLL
jgi:COMPASS component BRE2